MIKNNEKGFALVLSLVLMLAMSLMGGALIVMSASDHQSNNKSDEYQQTFYVAETALLEGEKYVLNQFVGPWNPANHKRNVGSRNFLMEERRLLGNRSMPVIVDRPSISIDTEEDMELAKKFLDDFNNEN